MGPSTASTSPRRTPRSTPCSTFPPSYPARTPRSSSATPRPAGCAGHSEVPFALARSAEAVYSGGDLDGAERLLA
ncbi:hypothetical protein ACFXJO_35120, partial [Streptomyces lavendulae]